MLSEAYLPTTVILCNLGIIFKSSRMKRLILFSLTFFGCLNIKAQVNHTDAQQTPQPSKRNIIKFNVMPMYMTEDLRNVNFGYERVINSKRTWSVNAGLLFFDPLIVDLYRVDKSERYDQFGYILGADYRYYLTQLNTRPTPAGVYIGPYANVYQNIGTTQYEFTRDRASSLISHTADITNHVVMLNLGFQMGYQYVFKNHITLNLVVFGPSLMVYYTDLTLVSNLTPNEQNEIFRKL